MNEKTKRPEDMVMIAQNEARAPKLQQALDGPFRIVSVRSNGILVIDKKRYQESIHMRRAKPFGTTTLGEDVMQ
ncbi:hypothetical protein GN244_ATG16236 [Phytophthora infestans]|uniref:Uncharacterized protein n=1 Tax=Phytophthora infestans TaxID=4787 RepID=A0A833WMQ9_PHYIN|nr:hypothetical protein GN244_ATG16236 [Phytophthora infestans]KAF4136692.1 hypothetical protein GN958_ATG14118 [Phytophthora infestans]